MYVFAYLFCWFKFLRLPRRAVVWFNDALFFLNSLRNVLLWCRMTQMHIQLVQLQRNCIEHKTRFFFFFFLHSFFYWFFCCIEFWNWPKWLVCHSIHIRILHEKFSKYYYRRSDGKNKKTPTTTNKILNRKLIDRSACYIYMQPASGHGQLDMGSCQTSKQQKDDVELIWFDW